jgi:hypothetical protein
MVDEIRYEIDQDVAAALVEAWTEAGMPDAVAVWRPGGDTVEFQDRTEVVARMEAGGLAVPESLRKQACLASPPMLQAFWVAVLLPHGVQYARVCGMPEGASA